MTLSEAAAAPFVRQLGLGDDTDEFYAALRSLQDWFAGGGSCRSWQNDYEAKHGKRPVRLVAAEQRDAEARQLTAPAAAPKYAWQLLADLAERHPEVAREAGRPLYAPRMRPRFDSRLYGDDEYRRAEADMTAGRAAMAELRSAGWLPVSDPARVGREIVRRHCRAVN
jgi:hypothetical protein